MAPAPRENPLDPALARTLAQKLQDGQLVLFAGAGLSHLAPAKDGGGRRIPLWVGLARAVAQRFGFDPEDFSGSPLDLFDAVIHAHSRGELEQAVTAALDDRDFELSEAHHALAGLPWRKLVTTNYDALLSRLVDERFPVADEAGYDRLRESKVIQIHGNLPQPHTLTRDDYRLWADKNPRAAHALRDFVLNHTLLFVGYSLSDPHLDETLALVREWTKGREKRLFGLFWQIPAAKQALLDRRDKITAASIETEEEWQNAFRQIKAELARLQANGPAAPVALSADPYAYDRAQYLQAIATRHGVANLQGLYIWGAGYARDDVKLEEIFVEPDLCEWQTLPKLRERDEGNAEADTPDDSEYTQARKRQERLRDQAPRRETALALLNRESRLCIIGAPGQGKSTLLRQHLLKTAAAWRDSPAQQPFPVYLRLSEWEQHPGGLLAWAKQAIAGLGEISGPALDAWLKGQVLWLLDGVDEIRDDYKRGKLQEDLLALLAQRPQDRAVLATRPQGYPLGGFGAAWRDTELPPLNPAQSRLVLANWGEVLKRKEANLFFDAPTVDRELERQPGLRQIRGNALLLTLVVLFYKNNRRLPHDRWEYFDKAENALRDSWLAYRLPEAAREKALPSGEYLPVFLERLALHGMKQGIVSFPASVLKETARALLQERGYTGREIDEEIKRLLRAADDLIGVIAAQAPERYGFLHLAFQEFLAARALVNRSDWCAAVIADYWDEPDWSEVWSFYAKWIGEDQARWKELFSVIQANTHDLDQYLHRDKLACLRLAGFSLGTLPKEMAKLESWALQELEPGYSLLVWDILKDWERSLSSDILGALLKHLDAIAILGINDRCLHMSLVGSLVGLMRIPEFRMAIVIRLMDEHIFMETWAVPKVCIEAMVEHAWMPEIQDLLLYRLGDFNWETRRAASKALSTQAGEPEIVSTLLHLLVDDNPCIRSGAIEALATQAMMPKIQKALLEKLEDEDWNVRQSSVIALTEQAEFPEVRVALLEMLKNGNMPAAAGALSNLAKEPEVRSALLALLEDEDWEMRKAGLEVLAKWADDPDVREAILICIGDDDWTVRYAAVSALENQAEIPEIRELFLQEMMVNDSGIIRASMVYAMAEKITDPEIQTALLARLEDIYCDVRLAAVSVLANQGDSPRIQEALLDRLNSDNNWEVRLEAAKGLVREASTTKIQEAFLRNYLKGSIHFRQVAAQALTQAALQDRRRQRRERT